MYFNNDDNEDDDFDFVIENDYGVEDDDDHQSIYVFLYYENVEVLIFSFW